MEKSNRKIGRVGAIDEICQKLTELRKRPLPSSVYEIIRENYENNLKPKKKVQDLEHKEGI